MGPLGAVGGGPRTDSTAPTTSAVGDAAASGSATTFAKRDHTHGREAFATPVAVGSANAAGVATTVPRSDHVHAGYGVQLADTKLSGTATNITFSSISQAYDDLEVSLESRGDGATAVENLLVQTNGVTTSTYDRQEIYGSNATTTSGATLAQSSWAVGTQPGANAARASIAGRVVLRLLNYVNTTFEKGGLALVGQVDSTAANGHAGATGLSNRATTALSSLKLFPQTSTNFTIGSRAIVRGLF